MIRNNTKKNIICKNKKLLISPIQKAIGLMFHKKIKDTGYIFIFQKPKRIDLHMFFVFFNIDLLFLDKNKRVIEIKEGFSPFCFYSSKKEASYLIELPHNIIKETKTELMDSIYF
jgi:uncharacterized protein